MTPGDALRSCALANSYRPTAEIRKWPNSVTAGKNETSATSTGALRESIISSETGT